MGVAERKAGSQHMAQMMKAAGTERRTGRCPICYGGVDIGPPQANTEGMSKHMLPGNCPGPAKVRPAIRKGDNHTDFSDSMLRHKRDIDLVIADMLGWGWSEGRITAFLHLFG